MPPKLRHCRIPLAASASLTWAATVVILTALAAEPPAADKPPAELTGKVVAVHDADTITVLVDGRRQVKVRLAAIDAPEIGQDSGRKAKQALSAKVFGKMVRVETAGEDQYGRTLGTVRLAEGQPEHSINHDLVAEGWAWHYKRYSDSKELADAESAARDDKLGLWADPNPVAPWDWRKQKREREAKAAREKSEQRADDEASASDKFWLNTSTGVRHNSTCKNFGKTKPGRYCGKDEGKACGICGG